MTADAETVTGRLLPSECPNCGRMHDHDFNANPGPVQRDVARLVAALEAADAKQERVANNVRALYKQKRVAEDALEAAERECEQWHMEFIFEENAREAAEARLVALREDFEMQRATASSQMRRDSLDQFWRGREGAFTDALATLDVGLADSAQPPARQDEGAS